MTLPNRKSLIVCLILFLGLQTPNSLSQSIKFNHLTVEDGLSNNKVNVVVQDSSGFIWFGTQDGLNRYDGYNFRIFRHSQVDTNSISSNDIWAMIVDHNGYLYAGTVDGILNRFDPQNETFIRFNVTSVDDNASSITALFEDSKHNIWIGTRAQGIFKWNPSKGEINNYNRDRSDSTTLSHPSIRAITEDSDGNIIIGTYFGLNKFNPDIPLTGFQRFFYNNEGNNSIIHDQVYNLTRSKSNHDLIWIGTPAGLSRFNSRDDSFQNIKIPNPENLQFGFGASTVIEELYLGDEILWTDTYGGLVRLNLSNGTASRFVHKEVDQVSLVDNRINRIIKDRSGVLWIVTENGISILSTKSMKFNSSFNKSYSSFLNTTEGKKNLNAISINKKGDVWLGFSDGIIKMQRYDKNNEYVKSIEISDFNVWSLIENDNKSLWVGTFGQGLIEYNLNSFRHKEWILRFPKLNTRTVSFVKSLLIDSRNNLWVGYWGSGLGRIDLKSKEYSLWLTQPSNPDAISHSDVWSIVQDNLGRIWIGTQGGGLNLANRQTGLFEDNNGGKFYHWMQNQHEENSLSNNNINVICEAVNLGQDQFESILWIGTSNGLNRFEIKNIEGRSNPFNIKTTNTFYTTHDGLPNNSVNSIVEDKNGNLWLGTGSGISFFNVKQKTFTNFSTADGINGSIMNPESAAMLENGIILMGSSDGLNIFDPDKINLSDYKPNLVITDFQIFNKSIKISNDSPLNKSLVASNKIELEHNQDVFSFEFAALDYNSSQSIQYAYKMEGFDKEWVESGNRRFVTYTNLDPGEYVFKIKSTNADGVWNDEFTTLNIILNPPWWKTVWAYGLYVLLIILGLIGIRRFELNRSRLRNELKLREFEVKKKSELEEIKSRFFANLSHEFRTPLMLIKGPLEQLKKENKNGSESENIDLIERNSERLKELIDQLLELSQLEKASISLKTRKENVVAMLSGLLSSFEYLAKQKNISISFESNTDSKISWVDRDKFEKIINNLLSNAFKFTPQGGEVVLKVGETVIDNKQFLKISICDSGVSIPKDKIDKIFDRFYQVDDSAQRSFGGSGVGLALVKEFVELHKWSISVESEKGKGTEFKLFIPMWDDYLNDDEKISDESINEINTLNLNKIHTKKIDSHNIETNEKPDSDKTSTILIVDDSEDVRRYISSLLESSYKISQAANGEEGIIAATENLPDLIISDVMMPSMDGMEFCRRIKSEWQTSDIPVILLTAKASEESKIEGLEIGADDYLTKPFDSKELFTRIKNLIEQRKRIREKFNVSPDALPETGNLNKVDNDFLNKFIHLVKNNIDKTNFGTEQLAKELFVSRTQLHRKIQAITGQAPGEFIRIIKLKTAAKLLIEGNFSVTQVAYEIGFSSPAQFTRAFSKQFNCVPSEYPSRQKNSY